jgi:hypothetical protein
LKGEEYFRNSVLHVKVIDWHVPTPRSHFQPSDAAPSLVVSHEEPRVSVKDVFVRLARQPAKYLFPRWNWKSALLSSILRASLFFATNLSAGFPAAMAALKTELVFRAVTSGFYGALTEAFREAEPPWSAALAIVLLQTTMARKRNAIQESGAPGGWGPYLAFTVQREYTLFSL